MEYITPYNRSQMEFSCLDDLEEQRKGGAAFKPYMLGAVPTFLYVSVSASLCDLKKEDV